MSVFVFMYHRTPVEAESRFDVSLATFKAQIDALIAAGVSIVPFGEVNRHASPGHGKHAALTFDDGHASNAPAFEFLSERGLRPSAFIVRRWAETGSGEHGAGYLRAGDLRAIAPICDLGAHGATHRGLAKIPLAEADAELRSSRAYLEDVLGRTIDTMVLPGGSGSPAVIDCAERAGYRLVGNSVFAPHIREGVSVKRIHVDRATGPDHLVRMVRAPGAYWAALEAERTVRRVRKRSLLTLRESVLSWRDLMRPTRAGA